MYGYEFGIIGGSMGTRLPYAIGQTHLHYPINIQMFAYNASDV